ncbi:hypothetical protein TPHA_0A04780 [Tetrapisispora phaffii CBS 4417]|uniref:Cargo-transport protein YPP1 n=1 Tax=Tetrapisispora phaffii (strain ATCC 24235 / CBS 4417 / NBRC 1672 / NRRL Y-8282 / UCD 70-5) TaxID=1071381 RepID=G8BNS5_TETPH|nr:hypothetical protein TPHA_0A04780 [Tetrapisispora phaffii CBS 4417]CCE61553.1 hypothetical protein TPHA_0A04780 [Tetrapisispora phaffii CBS 4417]
MISIAQTLSSRLIGANVFCSADENLNKVLTLQFRVHYHVFGLTTTKAIGNNIEVADIQPKNANVLLSDCEKLLSKIKSSEPTRDLLQKILFNCMGMISFHTKDIQKSKNFFQKSNSIKINAEDQKKFETYLKLESLYYGSKINNNNLQLYYDNLLPVLNNRIPSESNGLTMHVLQLILEQLKSNTNDDIKTFFSLFKSDSPVSSGLLPLIVCYIYRTNKNIKLDEFFLSIGNDIISKAKFPSAEEQNNEELEQFLVFLDLYFRDEYTKSVSNKWKQFLISSIASTFQSISVARAALVYFGKFGESENDMKESILNFVNYTKYSNKEAELQEEDNIEEYRDIISLIDAYAYTLKIAHDESTNIENLYDFDDTSIALSNLLKTVYEQNNFNFIDNNDASDWKKLSLKLNLPGNVKFVLFNAWKTLYEIRQNKLEYLTSNNLSIYLANSICLVNDLEQTLLPELEFLYAYNLAQQRQLEPATSFLKSVTLEKFPEHYKSWHLLALCDSAVNEDKETAFKIVCSVLEAMKLSLEQNKLTPSDRWQYIHLQLTQLSIVEDNFGTSEALDLLPEVLELYSTLFPEGSEDSFNLGTEVSQSKEYLLQTIWNFAANMYMNINEEFLEQADDAITEAVNVSKKFKNLNCNITKGNLFLTQEAPNKALKEFEYVLHYDKYNLEALLGLAEIVLDSGKNEKTSNSPDEYYTLVPQNNMKQRTYSNNIFANEKDQLATIARLKYLLEYATSHKVEAYYSAEIWWYLSLIYEKYQDKRYKSSIMNCIRFKEATPIRSFKFCNY